MEYMWIYLMVTFGFYVGTTFSDVMEFRNTELVRVISGLIVSLLWPYIIFVGVYYGLRDFVKALGR